jgi:hypothetical protein
MAAAGAAGLPATSGVRPDAGGDGGNDRARAREAAARDRVGGVEVGGDEPGPGPHCVGGALQPVEVEGPVEPDDHRVDGPSMTTS